jgi:hypothetical protein
MKNDIKTVEIRDRGTLIPAFAIRMLPANEKEAFFFNESGYRSKPHPCILLIPFEAPWQSVRSSDEQDGRNGRTLSIAHKWIEDHFDEIEACQVIDVEFILKEVDKPCLSAVRERVQEMLNRFEGKDIDE